MFYFKIICFFYKFSYFYSLVGFIGNKEIRIYVIRGKWLVLKIIDIAELRFVYRENKFIMN